MTGTGIIHITIGISTITIISRIHTAADSTVTVITAISKDRMRARNLAREAQYKDLRAQQDELRRLREEGTKENRQRRGRHPKNDRKARKKAQKAAARAAKKKGGFGRKIRKLIAILLILLLVFSGYFLILCSHFDKVDTGNSDFAIDPGVEDSLGGFLSGYRNIAVLGSDARSNEPLDGSRTDAIIILSIKRSNGDINMISIMRDSFLKQENSEHDLIRWMLLAASRSTYRKMRSAI